MSKVGARKGGVRKERRGHRKPELGRKRNLDTGLVFPFGLPSLLHRAVSFLVSSVGSAALVPLC